MKTPQEIAAEQRFVVVCADDAYERGWLSPEGRHDEARWNWCLFDTSTNPPTVVGEDGGEPEDQRLVRDWRWVPEALNKYTAAAREEGRREGIEQAVLTLKVFCEDNHEYPCKDDDRLGRTIRALASQPKPEPAVTCEGCERGLPQTLRLGVLSHYDMDARPQFTRCTK